MNDLVKKAAEKFGIKVTAYCTGCNSTKEVRELEPNETQIDTLEAMIEFNRIIEEAFDNQTARSLMFGTNFWHKELDNGELHAPAYYLRRVATKEINDRADLILSSAYGLFN